MKHLARILALPILALNALSAGLLLFAAYSPRLSPEDYPLLSCMGLTFPIFLAINAGFLFLWIALRRYRSALLPLATLLLCCVQIRTYLPVNFSASRPPEESIKLLSYNVMGFGDSTRTDGENPILTYLKHSGADILCLQEYVVAASSRHPSQKEVERQLAAYPYRCIHTVGTAKSLTNRLACYSKFPILSSRILQPAGRHNGSVLYLLKVGNDTLTLINSHLESNKLTRADKEAYEDMLDSPGTLNSRFRLLLRKLAEASTIRSRQAHAVAHEVAASPYPYVIVCGDFNDTPVSYTHRVIARPLHDAFVRSGCGPGISYNRNKFYFRIDNILTSANLKAYRCIVDRSIKASDHYPIWCFIAKKRP